MKRSLFQTAFQNFAEKYRSTCMDVYKQLVLSRKLDVVFFLQSEYLFIYNDKQR